jgi:hypothetical protein
MPSKDRIDPQANEWMVREGLLASDPERRSATSSAARGRTGSRTERRVMSAQVLRLAKRLDVDADELAKKFSPDTVRRTKYPVLEQVDEQGRRVFKHDPQIEERRISTFSR